MSVKEALAKQKLTNREHAKIAARAHTNLTVFHAAINIFEGGCIYHEGSANADAQRIIDLCKAAAGRQLRLMDRHMKAIRNV
jgi:BioD-like phosphotransacetylase family protein